MLKFGRNKNFREWKPAASDETGGTAGGNSGSGSGTGKPSGVVRTILIVVGLVIALNVGAALVSSVMYKVDEQENAVVTMFGKVIRTDTAGLHFKIPFVQNVQIVDMTTHGVGIGYSVDGNGQNFQVDDDAIMITSDFNFVDIDFYLEYKVNDPISYLYNSKQPEMILKNAALATIRSAVSDYTVDDVITTGKAQLQSEIKERLTASLQEKDIGLQLVNIQIQDAEPPTSEVVQAFKAVETAKQGKETALNNANRYRNESLPKAEADADKVIQSAEAAKQARIAEAEGEVARFEKMYEEYRNYPEITKQRLYYETMEKVLPGQKIIITDGETQQILPLQPFNAAETEGGEE